MRQHLSTNILYELRKHSSLYNFRNENLYHAKNTNLKYKKKAIYICMHTQFYWMFLKHNSFIISNAILYKCLKILYLDVYLIYFFFTSIYLYHVIILFLQSWHLPFNCSDVSKLGLLFYIGEFGGRGHIKSPREDLRAYNK